MGRGRGLQLHGVPVAEGGAQEGRPSALRRGILPHRRSGCGWRAVAPVAGDHAGRRPRHPGPRSGQWPAEGLPTQTCLSETTGGSGGRQRQGTWAEAARLELPSPTPRSGSQAPGMDDAGSAGRWRHRKPSQEAVTGRRRNRRHRQKTEAGRGGGRSRWQQADRNGPTAIGRSQWNGDGRDSSGVRVDSGGDDGGRGRNGLNIPPPETPGLLPRSDPRGQGRIRP